MVLAHGGKELKKHVYLMDTLGCKQTHFIHGHIRTLYNLGRCLGDCLPSTKYAPASEGREDGRIQWRRGEISAASGMKLFYHLTLPLAATVLPYA